MRLFIAVDPAPTSTRRSRCKTQKVSGYSVRSPCLLASCDPHVLPFPFFPMGFLYRELCLEPSNRCHRRPPSISTHHAVSIVTFPAGSLQRHQGTSWGSHGVIRGYGFALMPSCVVHLFAQRPDSRRSSVATGAETLGRYPLRTRVVGVSHPLAFALGRRRRRRRRSGRGRLAPL